ncbi:alanine racemase [Leptobacterium sp. I13]|uniref:alanine racemase n=1 Tax=Leptobacterium meishanense TaxID=3128904 RepID=UPI0030EE59E4
MPIANETVLEINLNHLKHNYEYLKSKLKPETKFLAVVKAFAYGSDAVEIARYLQDELNVDYFAVAYVNEGVMLRNAGITAPILVLHPQKANLEMLIERCLEPSIYSFYILNAFLDAAEKNKQTNYPVHIKFNTGLNRLGFESSETNSLVSILKEAPQVKVTSVFSHLAASEDLNEKDFTLAQIEEFKKIAAQFESEIGFRPMLHLLNTSGILNYAAIAQFDMVRSGIGLYGFGNDPNYNQHLKPIATLKSVVSQIHNIAPRESVGYNRGFIASEKMKTATIPIGHADGIGRQYGNGNGFVTIHGKKAPIVGNVCMDMLMVNITDIHCHEGDEVILFGQNPNVATFAATANTISYELLTAVSQRVKRVVFK